VLLDETQALQGASFIYLTLLAHLRLLLLLLLPIAPRASAATCDAHRRRVTFSSETAERIN